MFETAIVAIILSALILTLCAGMGSLLLHRMFGADLPAGVQPLDNLFKSVISAGAAVLLAPFKFFMRGEPPPPRVPPSETKTITQQ